jgi:hypothetical protein
MYLPGPRPPGHQSQKHQVEGTDSSRETRPMMNRLGGHHDGPSKPEIGLHRFKLHSSHWQPAAHSQAGETPSAMTLLSHHYVVAARGGGGGAAQLEIRPVTVVPRTGSHSVAHLTDQAP